MNEKLTPGAASHKRTIKRADANLMPLTSEALAEQSLFAAVLALATRRGHELTRTAAGYRVSCLNMTRHYIDLSDAAAFVRSAQKTNNDRPTGQGEQP